jgi:hypothetical protein
MKLRQAQARSNGYAFAEILLHWGVVRLSGISSMLPKFERGASGISVIIQDQPDQLLWRPKGLRCEEAILKL